MYRGRRGETMTGMLTIQILLLLCAFVLWCVSAAGKTPAWVPLLPVILLEAFRLIPTK